MVGNNWEGTADVVDPRTFERLIRLNIILDYDERVAEIMADPPAAGYFTGISLLIGEGNNQYVDDAFTTHDGRLLIVSRPSFKDVVGINLATRRIAWRFQVDGYRSDHMAISPDGRVLVSASTGNVVHALDTRTGKEVGRFPSGDSPHENNYLRRRQSHLPREHRPGLHACRRARPRRNEGRALLPGGRRPHLRVLKRVVMGEKLREAGYPNMSSAVRPMAIAPDERHFYLQISFFHGFVEYDLRRDKVLRVAHLPISDEAKQLRREQYLLDSAHHGISMDPRGREAVRGGHDVGLRGDRLAGHVRPPHSRAWREALLGHHSGDGRYCFISYSGDDRVGVISYARERRSRAFP